MQGLLLVDKTINPMSGILGLGGLTSFLGGLWGYVMTADSLVPVFALAAGAACGIVYLWNKPRELDVKRQMEFKDSLIQDRESLYRREVADHYKTMRLLAAWKAAAISKGADVNEAEVIKPVEVIRDAAQ